MHSIHKPDDTLALLKQPAVEVAPQILGWELRRTLGNTVIRARIVETEAYYQDDAASHSFRGVTPRTEIMFDKSGRLYVYFTYGMHYCANIVCGEESRGEAVLIRALEPIEGIERMRVNRGQIHTDFQLTNGPAKLCQALQIDKQLNGHNLLLPPLLLIPHTLSLHEEIITTTRVGISRAKDALLRFYIANNPYVSRS